MENPVGLSGIEFVEFASPTQGQLENLFSQFGFKKIGENKKRNLELFGQGGINFIINNDDSHFAAGFKKQHGPSICSMGWRVENAEAALKTAVERGAEAVGDDGAKDYPFPAIYGIGGSVIYFVDQWNDYATYKTTGFEITGQAPEGLGFSRVDHLTNNVPEGDMYKWKDFYEKIFNFEQIRFFDIRGEKTGLLSLVMRSPCKKIIIPINEPTEEKSQIQEYLNEYHGSGVQHLALLTDDIMTSVSRLRENSVEFLDAPPEAYYEMIPERIPNVTESTKRLSELDLLVDGDEEGYLLQIFTKNIVGPIFFEIIQRKNHDGFGEGNFQALFDSIERDQVKRGFIQE